MQKKQLSFVETLAMATGFTIGSGIITQTGFAIAQTGRSVCVAFICSAVLFLIAYRPLFILGQILPKESGSYYYTTHLLSPSMGGFYAYAYLLGRFTIVILGISFAQYMAEMIPALSGAVSQKIMAVALVTCVFWINLKGIKAAAVFQKITTAVLICGFAVYIIFGLPAVQSDFFEPSSFFTNGFSGFYAAVSLLFFAISGSSIMVDFASEIKNSQTVLLKVMLLVTLGITVLYTFLGVVASGTVPVETAANVPLTVSAVAVFAKNRPLYLFFVIGACIGALVTTLNSSFTWYTSALTRCCHDGWLPSFLLRENRNGVPYRLQSLFYLFAVIPTCLGIDLAMISRITISLTMIATSIPMAGMINLPQRYPVEWQNSRYNKYSPLHLKIMISVTYVILVSQIISLLSQNPLPSNLFLILYFVIIVIILMIRKRKLI